VNAKTIAMDSLKLKNRGQNLGYLFLLPEVKDKEIKTNSNCINFRS
jgi:hypothetical protein